MATLTFNGASYTVDHAVKGADYIHGYDANGIVVAAFEGVKDFGQFTYTGTYMSPEKCLDDANNNVRHVNGVLVRCDGTAATHASAHAKDGDDPLLPGSIGAPRIYTSLAELGISEGSETASKIHGKLKVGEIITYATHTNNSADGVYPSKINGTFYAHCLSSQYTICRFSYVNINTGVLNEYVGAVAKKDAIATYPTFTGWYPVTLGTKL